MIADLGSPDPDQRADAVANLRVFGAKARTVAGRLEKMLDDPAPLVRVKAAVVLLSVDPVNPRVVPALVSALDSTDIDVLDDAISAIEKLGSKAAVTAPKLKRILARTDLTNGNLIGDDLAYEVASMKARTAKALVFVAPNSGDGVAALIALLKDSRNGELAALEPLGRLGPRAAGAVPTLVAIVQNPKGDHFFEAMQALTRIDGGHEALLPALMAFLSVEPLPTGPGECDGVTDGLQREDVILAIGRMGARALPAVTSLVRLLEANRDDKQISLQSHERVVAARALGRIGPGAKVAVPALVRVMKTESDHSARIAAIRSLAALGPAATSAVPFLIEMLTSDIRFPSFAVQALGSIGPEAQGAIPALINRLNDKNPDVAAEAAVALLRIDPSKRDLLEARLPSMPVTNHLHARDPIRPARAANAGG